MERSELGPPEEDLQLIQAISEEQQTVSIEVRSEPGPLEEVIKEGNEVAELGPIEDDVKLIKVCSRTEQAVLELNPDDPIVQEAISLSNEISIENDDNSVPVFTIAEGGTKRGGRLLLDSRGYSFTVKLSGKSSTTWKCSVRSRVKRCPATVRQTVEGFKEGKQWHNHASKPKSITKVNIVTEIKERSKLMMNDTARNVVTDVIAKYYNTEMIAGGLPNTQTLIRLANRARAGFRPNNPKNLNFKINDQYMPEDFIKADIECNAHRHILMATNDQLSILADTKVWMVDCTNKFVQHPFMQLLSIHTFVRLDQDLTPIPLAFVLMSKNRKRDYKAVLEHLLKLLPHRQSIRKCVLDFDIPLWKAFQSVIPQAVMQGCAFHWIKNVMKKIPKTSLEAEMNLSKKLMALVYLPPEEIEDAFNRLRKKKKRCQLLFQHIDKHWVNNSFWSPQVWSVFEQVVRTTEDVEGWHENIVMRGKGVGMYKLVHQLNILSSLDLPHNWKLVSEEKLYTLQKLKKDWQQARLFKLWKKYLRHKISIDELLTGCTHLDYPLP